MHTSQRNEALLRIFWTADYTERYAATNKTYQRSESEEWDAHMVERFHDGFYYKFHLPSDAVLSGGSNYLYTLPNYNLWPWGIKKQQYQFFSYYFKIRATVYAFHLIFPLAGQREENILVLPSHWHRVSVQPTTDYHAKYLNITKGDVLKC